MKRQWVLGIVLLILIFAGCKAPAGQGEQQADAQVQKEEKAEEKAEEPADESELDFDFTGGSLLSTTDIKWLTMEVGGTADEVRFNWFSTSAAAGMVEWENTQTGEIRQIEAECTPSVNREEYYVNKASVNGILPGETYRYRVGNEESWSPAYSYQAPAETGGELTFLVTSDTQLGQSSSEPRERTAERWDGVLTKITSEVPEAQFLFHLGDHVACFGSGRDYELFLDHLALYSIPLAPIVGNHDVPNIWSVEQSGYASGPYFYEHLNVPNRSKLGQTTEDSFDGNYYFIRGNVLFLIINDGCESLEEQEQYVAEIVTSHPEAKWRILAKHYPPFIGVESANPSDSQGWIADLAERYDIDLVLTGHEHAYSRTGFIDQDARLLEGYDYETGGAAENPEGVLYVTCSTSSGCLYHYAGSVQEERIVYHGQPEAPMASKIHVTDTELKLTTYVTDPWSVFDEYTIRKE